MSKLIIIISLIIILFFTLFLQKKYSENPYITYENFDQNVPTPIALPVRSDMTCSGVGESIIYDRYDNAGSNSMGTGLIIPPSFRNNNLSNSTGNQTPPTLDTANPDYNTKCIGGTDTTNDTYGTKIFVDTGNPALKTTGSYWYDNGTPYNLVDMYCCKGQMYQVPGTSQSNCLPLCPSNYTMDPIDNTICVRNDSNCVYTADLSANISQNWLNTCAMIYKQNIDITSTIQSISSVVSTFGMQTSNINSDYNNLSHKLYNTTTTNSSYLTNRDNNFHNITDTYNTVTGIQGTINGTYNDLKAKKATFDTLYNQFACSNYQF